MLHVVAARHCSAVFWVFVCDQPKPFLDFVSPVAMSLFLAEEGDADPARHRQGWRYHQRAPAREPWAILAGLSRGGLLIWVFRLCQSQSQLSLLGTLKQIPARGLS